MPSSFPGMDPYLENPFLWHDVHQALAGQIRRQIAPRLAPRYVARLETRFVSSTPDGQTVSVLYPDVNVTSVQARERATVTYKPLTDTAVAPSPPLVLHVAPSEERVRLITVAIRDVARRELVTSIEILSPVNKRLGGGLGEYRAKRATVISAGAHLLEIDLLRQGTRAPRLIDLPESDYFVFLTRAERRDQVETWPIGVRDPLPAVPIPLLPGDDDVILDLSHALRAIYDEARYDLSIDYGQPPVPPLSDDDAEWARTLDV
ncbi:MAG: DUF4058 family protein [Chloroflexota bacterium]|nr:DUF4058 family protein [Chloroflexota bacterium]